jgi:AcrR family transcriptional regulator
MARPRRISDEAALAGALKVMFRNGPAEFTLAAVAAEVGIAPPTLVQRFGDKRGLILRALAQDNGEFAAIVAEAPRMRGRASVIGLFRLLTP